MFNVMYYTLVCVTISRSSDKTRTVYCTSKREYSMMIGAMPLIVEYVRKK